MLSRVSLPKYSLKSTLSQYDSNTYGFLFYLKKKKISIELAIIHMNGHKIFTSVCI